LPDLPQYARNVERGISVKAIMLFSTNDQRAGWSEVYNIGAGDVNTGINAMTALAQVRCTIMSPDCTINGFRFTLPLVAPNPPFIRAQRTAYLYVTSIPGSYKQANVVGSADVAWTGVMCRLNDATRTVFRNQTYRGIPVGFWQGNDNAAKAEMQNFTVQWRAALIANQANILHKNRVNGLINPVPITSVEYIRVVRRASGRAFDTLRGRR
jgi:hypothetical protein